MSCKNRQLDIISFEILISKEILVYEDFLGGSLIVCSVDKKHQIAPHVLTILKILLFEV